MHNTWTELLLTLNDSGATHFCVAPTARKGASYDLTLAALGKKRKKAARGVRFKSGLRGILITQRDILTKLTGAEHSEQYDNFSEQHTLWLIYKAFSSAAFSVGVWTQEILHHPRHGLTFTLPLILVISETKGKMNQKWNKWIKSRTNWTRIWAWKDRWVAHMT